MNELAELRMEEYNRLSEKYKKLEAITVELLEENLKNKDLRPMHITHRIKTAESSIGKLERKPDKYKNLSALTTGSFRTSRNEGGSGSHLPLPPVPCNPPRRLRYIPLPPGDTDPPRKPLWVCPSTGRPLPLPYGYRPPHNRRTAAIL